jgi:hypothetical protein
MKHAAVAIVLAAVALAACSEEGVASARGRDMSSIQPWDSPEAGGEKAQWEQQIEARTLNQNDYARTR